jgi:putative chitinase
MIIDRAAFFAAVRASGVAGTPLKQASVDSLEAILDAWARYPDAPFEEIAYTMATARHEAWHPRQKAIRHDIKEIGGARRPYGQPHPKTGRRYFGRGLTQLTHYDNYARLGRELGLDLVGDPDLALRKDVSSAALVIGSVEGAFTGGKLADYLPHDPVGARRVINGDAAEIGPIVAAYYAKFLDALRGSASPDARPSLLARLKARLGDLLRRVLPSSTSTRRKDDIMTDTKAILASRTVWANIIGLVCVGLAAVGVDTGSIEIDKAADAAAQVVAAISFIASTVFRLTATKQLMG